MEPAEAMTLAEVAEYLQLAERTVLRMAQRGEIPAAKVASQWRFLRPLVREWLISQMQALPKATADRAAKDLGRVRPLTEVMRRDLMVFDLTPGPKERVLQQLVAPLVRGGAVGDPSRFLESLLARERMMTTGIGHGVAIPHPRRPIPGMFAEPLIVLGVCAEGTDYDAIDEQLVRVFFLIGATRTEVHLDLMAKITWLTRQPVVGVLAQATDPDEALGAVAGVMEALEGEPAE
jgi:PTS system nitrogen regulatory IIA component